MMYPICGLPGGSSGEGPATTLGIILMVSAAAIFVVTLLALLFYAADMIEHSSPHERHQRLVESFALSDNG